MSESSLYREYSAHYYSNIFFNSTALTKLLLVFHLSLAGANQKPRPVAADIVFLLDHSRHVDKGTFNREESFMKSVARRLKINWHKSRIGVATYWRTAYLRMRRQRLSLKRATGALAQIPYRRESNRRVNQALKKSASFFSNRFSRKILVAIVDARFRTKIGRELRSFNKRVRFLSNLQNQLRRRGVKLFIAAVGLTASQVRGINNHLRAIAGHQRRRVFLFSVPSFRKLINRASFVARGISEETVRYLRARILVALATSQTEIYEQRYNMTSPISAGSHLSERKPRVWNGRLCLSSFMLH